MKTVRVRQRCGARSFNAVYSKQKRGLGVVLMDGGREIGRFYPLRYASRSDRGLREREDRRINEMPGHSIEFIVQPSAKI